MTTKRLILVSSAIAAAWALTSFQKEVKGPQPSKVPTSRDASMAPSHQLLQNSLSTSFPQTRKKTSLLKRIQNLARSFDDPSKALSEDAMALDRISDQELQALQNYVLSSHIPGEERRASLFLLTQAGEQALPYLSDIAQTPLDDFSNLNNPHSTETLSKQFEVALRITALEAMDKLSMQTDRVLPYLQEVRDQLEEPSLALLADISISGIQNNRPGKLIRVIDAMMKEKSL